MDTKEPDMGNYCQKKKVGLVTNGPSIKDSAVTIKNCDPPPPPPRTPVQVILPTVPLNDWAAIMPGSFVKRFYGIFPVYILVARLISQSHFYTLFQIVLKANFIDIKHLTLIKHYQFKTMGIKKKLNAKLN